MEVAKRVTVTNNRIFQTCSYSFVLSEPTEKPPISEDHSKSQGMQCQMCPYNFWSTLAFNCMPSDIYLLWCNVL